MVVRRTQEFQGASDNSTNFGLITNERDTKLNDCQISKLIDLKLVREILVDSGVQKSTRPQTRDPRALFSAHQSFKTLQATPDTNVKITKDPGYKTHWLSVQQAQ